MSEFIEGRNAVVEALRSEQALEAVLIAGGTRANPVMDEIRLRARVAGVPVQEVARAELDLLSARGAHQGVIARAAAFRYAELDTVLHATRQKERSLVVVLDHVTDPGNLGAAVRSVEVAGGDAVIVPRVRAASIGPIAHKASAGATSYLPIIQVTNVAQALERLKEDGYWVVGADERAADNLWRAALDGRLVIVLGAEGSGMARLTRERCDFLVSIPVAGRVSSLNVAQAASVLAFEWVRRGA